ncbi:A/G-specific adenine glycosylase [Bacillus thermotolerans]|uniref:A/G-specific adenine glycosylase n=1 Tax=Bacillus thermotolerans TaxID=1221996 RepID=UPI00057E29BC|nr:A/G-specific adenine glycosylase [Bacillus thermotolerans]KKB33761.1 A/G-specific adenine glycosylase [Bacillus thermotolerans]
MNFPSLDHIEKTDITQFQQDLLNWYKEEKRDLPWRYDQDPYKVWVSEIMLQQTRVDTVIPYFERFIEQFPTIEALAEAEEEKVLKAWEGLGYYSRVRNLQAAVKEVHEQYGGKVPDTKEVISSLKGVGPYTSGAILSIAYGVPEPAVDGNVMRVLSRIFSIWDDIAKASTRKVFEEAVRRIISKEDPSSFNQALMELGALICTPTSPACLLCPVRDHCHAFHEGTADELPIKTKKKNMRHVHLAAAVLQTEGGEVLIQKRPESGLLANLWEFPNTELSGHGHPKVELELFLEREYGIESTLDKEPFAKIQHVFSHLTWDIDVYKGTMASSVPARERSRLVSSEEVEQYAFSVSHQKIWKQAKKNGWNHS